MVGGITDSTDVSLRELREVAKAGKPVVPQSAGLQESDAI